MENEVVAEKATHASVLLLDDNATTSVASEAMTTKNRTIPVLPSSPATKSNSARQVSEKSPSTLITAAAAPGEPASITTSTCNSTATATRRGSPATSVTVPSTTVPVHITNTTTDATNVNTNPAFDAVTVANKSPSTTTTGTPPAIAPDSNRVAWPAHDPLVVQPADSRTDMASTTMSTRPPTTTTTAIDTASISTTTQDSTALPSIESAVTLTDTTPPKQVNGHKENDDGDESELSEPSSIVHSPLGPPLDVLADEIVVGQRVNGINHSPPVRVASDSEDITMTDAIEESTVPHYPKRKRNSVFQDLSESKMETPASTPDNKSYQTAGSKQPRPPRQTLGSVKGVTLGHWRDSTVPDEKDRHAVIGFIDSRDRLRTRIQPVTQSGQSLAQDYPLPPGPGGSWVTFEKVAFNKPLVGLDHFQVKEYVRIRSEASEDTEEDRRAAERAAVKEAIRRVKENPLIDSLPNPPPIAYGTELPDLSNGPPSRPDAKRRRTNGGFSGNSTTNGTSLASPTSQSDGATQFPRSVLDPLAGARPTRILLGCWKGSSEPDPKDRHAIYGILSQNDMFRVKLVRETRDGRYMDGNFPVGAGALWVSYEEVEFEEHLKPLARTEIKEYCRVRQRQIDQGETLGERHSNEVKAVEESQARIGAGYRGQQVASSFTSASDEPELAEPAEPTTTRTGFGGHELRQSRRVEAKNDARAAARQTAAEVAARSAAPAPTATASAPASRTNSAEALERTNTLARREIAKAEAAQIRADRNATNRERAAAAAAADTAKAAAAAAAVPETNGRLRFGDSEDVQRLNQVWARQESLRMKAGAEDAKIYGGIKYERKTTGPFIGKLVSQGAIISIDGEDYVEYRVLTKPAFF